MTPYLSARRLPTGLLLVPVVTLIILGVLSGCGESESPDPRSEPGSIRNPWLIVGIDGAEWKVIEHLWAKGQLPNLKKLADSGTRSTLKTSYSTSPIIWTTLATGHLPEVHGITGFTVPTDKGEVPVSSSNRKVPALWNMADRAGLSVAVLGWWATWPAETIRGLMISDRALRPVDRPFSPESLEPRLASWKAAARAKPNRFGGNLASQNRDQLMSHAARELGPEGYDLTLLYYRSVDIESHNSWKYFEPETFNVRPAELLANRDRIPDAYIAVDEAIANVLDAMPDNTNVLVVSDHGFHAKEGDELQILLDMNRILEHLGYVTLLPDGKADLAKTRIYSYGTAKNKRTKRLRFNLRGREPGGLVDLDGRDALRAALDIDLARLTYEDGSAIFMLRDSSAKVQHQGTDFEALVLAKGASQKVLFDGQPIDDLIEQVTRVSGTHAPDTHGILIASGPDIAPGADVEGISIFDFAPTLLYGLGLPVADDFSGEVFHHLFTGDFQSTHPLRRVASWGSMNTWKQFEASPVDQELIDELQSLGYI